MRPLPGDNTGLSARDTEGDRYVRYCRAHYGPERVVWPSSSSVRQRTGGFMHGIPLPTEDEVKASVQAQLGPMGGAGAGAAAGGSGPTVAKARYDAVKGERNAARATLQAIADSIAGGRPNSGTLSTAKDDVDVLIGEWEDYTALLQRISGAVQSAFDLTTLGDDVDALAGENTQLRARVAALSPQRPPGAPPDVAQLQSDLAAAQADIQHKDGRIAQLQQDLQTAQQDLTDLQNEMHAVHAKTPGATKFTRWLPGVTTELDAAADRHGDLVTAVGGLYAHFSLTTASSAPGQVQAIGQAYDQQIQEAQAVLRKFLAPGDPVPDSMDRVLAELDAKVDQSLQELDALKQQPVGGPSVVSPSASAGAQPGGAQAPLQQELQQKQQELDALKASMGTSLDKVTRMLHRMQKGNGKARTATDVANLDAALDALGREAREWHQNLLARAGMNAPTDEGALLRELASMATSRGALVQKINEMYGRLQNTHGEEGPQDRLQEMLERMYTQEHELGTLQAKVLGLLEVYNMGRRTSDMDGDLAQLVRDMAQNNNVQLGEELDALLNEPTFTGGAPPGGGSDSGSSSRSGTPPPSSDSSRSSSPEPGKRPPSPTTPPPLPPVVPSGAPGNGSGGSASSSRSPSPSTPGSPRQPGVQDGERGIFGFLWDNAAPGEQRQSDKLVQPDPDRFIAEVAETEAEIDKKYEDQVVVFTGEDVPDAGNKRFPNFPTYEEGSDEDQQGLVTRQDALRGLVTLIQDMGGPKAENVEQTGMYHGMYEAMYDTENDWEHRGALFWDKYRPDPDLDFLWANRVEMSGYGGAGVPMWLLLPEKLCTPRMWEAKQAFLQFVQAKKEWRDREPMKSEVGGDRFWGAKEAWGSDAPAENPIKRLPGEPRRRRRR